MTAPLPQQVSPRKALIFRSELLRYSETFIPGQAENFRTFTPIYAGFKKVKGIDLPPDRTLQPSTVKLIGRIRNMSALLGVIDPWFENAVRQAKPELIHAHFEEGGLRALTLAKHLKLPLFVTCHGYDVTVSRQRWQNWPGLGQYYQGRRQALFKRASLCIGVSRFICDKMLQRGYPPEKIRLHHIGIDTERFCPDPTIPKQPAILFVGRLVEKKGVIDLLQAMKRVASHHPDVKLNLIGDGPLRESLEKFARQEKLNVAFHGIQPPDVVQQFLQVSLVFCMPSVRAANGDSEGLGMVSLESQAAGVPLVGTWHGGIPEAAEHGVTGLLSPERDPAALAENINTLLSDSALRVKMGSAARARVTEHFDLKTQSRVLENIYLQFL